MVWPGAGKRLDNQLFAVVKVRQGDAILKEFQSAGGGMRYEILNMGYKVLSTTVRQFVFGLNSIR